MNIICLFKGHDLQFREMLNPFERSTLPSVGVDAFGNVRVVPSVKIGWIHYGYFSTCQRCRKRLDADNLDLPLLYPK